MIVYDISREETFVSVRKWLENLRNHAEAEIQLILVGNKSDLPR